MAEGMVFPFFTDEKKDGYVIDELPDDLQSWVISADYGQNHPCVFGSLGFSPSQNRWILTKEFYTNQKPNSVYSEEFSREFMRDGIVAIDVDPGGGGVSLRNQLRVDYPDKRPIIKSAIKVDVNKELQQMSTALYKKQLVIYRECQRTISEMGNYVWSPKSAESGVEEPIKVNNDGVDMLRYGWNRIIKLNKMGYMRQVV
jgi:hypothetical protein